MDGGVNDPSDPLLIYIFMDEFPKAIYYVQPHLNICMSAQMKQVRDYLDSK